MRRGARGGKNMLIVLNTRIYVAIRNRMQRLLTMTTKQRRLVHEKGC